MGANEQQNNLVGIVGAGAMGRGIAQVVSLSGCTVKLFDVNKKDIIGPIGIAKISGNAISLGLPNFLFLMALLSINLGLINLFPIPMLDGGHLMFYGFEKILGRPLSQKTQEGFFRIGMFLLLSLMFFATFNAVSYTHLTLPTNREV